MVDLCRRLGVPRVYALCHPDHIASQHVLEKGGFSRDRGWSASSAFPNLSPGGPMPSLRYDLVLRSEARDARSEWVRPAQRLTRGAMKASLMACILGVGLQSPALPSQTEWRLGSPPGVYEMDASGKATLADGASLTLRSVSAANQGGGSVLASIPAESLRGRRA